MHNKNRYTPLDERFPKNRPTHTADEKERSPRPAAAAANPAARQTAARQTAARLIPIGQIEPDQRNPRLEPTESDLPLLAASLDKLDLLNPIQVRPTGEGSYRVIAGERRYRAAKLAGWTQIPAVVRDVDEATAAQIMVCENMLQRHLNDLERARSLDLLCKPVEKGGAGLSLVEAAKVFGKTRPWACNLIRLLRLPADWQQRLAAGEVNGRCARALVPYVDRPDVLAAVAADLAANKEEWRTSDVFDQRLAFVVAQLDNLAAAADPQLQRADSARPACPPQTVTPELRNDQAQAEGQALPTVPPIQPRLDVRPSPRPADGSGGHLVTVKLVSQIGALIEQLATVDQVDDVQTFLTARREAVEHPRRRKVVSGPLYAPTK